MVPEFCFFLFRLLQWQASSRQHFSITEFEPDKNSWGWNWLERWMVVHPWESRFLGAWAADGIAMVSEARHADWNATKTPYRKPVRRHTSAPHSTAMNQACLTYSEKSRLKLLPREGPDEAQYHPSGLGVRSGSNSKERTGHLDCKVNKRLSLPANGKYHTHYTRHVEENRLPYTRHGCNWRFKFIV